jgi:hypothetical protein
MNRLTNSEIWERVETDYKEAQKNFPNNRILGTFLLGPANFGYVNQPNELTTITFIFPTFENVAINSGYVKTIKYNKSGGRIEWVDFREFYDLVQNEDGYTEIIFTEFFIANPLYQKRLSGILQGQTLSFEGREFAVQDWGSQSEVEEFCAGLTALLKQYLAFADGVQEQLFSALTKTEEKALIYVLETIGTEGNLSISAAIAYSGISRPVFTSLFEKLDRYHGAEIKNQGVKGTYINFYDHVLSKFNII